MLSCDTVYYAVEGSYRVFSHDVTAAILVSKTMKRRPCWCPKPILWELNSFLMQTLSFVPINLHRCWLREWKHSITLSLWQIKPYGVTIHMKGFELYFIVVLFTSTSCFYHILSLWMKATERCFSLVLFIGHQEVLLCSLGYIKYSCCLRVSIKTCVLYCAIFHSMK